MRRLPAGASPSPSPIRVNTIQEGSFLTLHYRLAGPDGADVVNTFGGQPATHGQRVAGQVRGVEVGGGVGELADAVDARRLEFAVLETLDVGKPIQHSYNDDAPTTVGVLRWYASLVETAYDRAPTRRAGVQIQIVREPQGVVGIILPWNYPLTTLALKLGPALAHGRIELTGLPASLADAGHHGPSCIPMTSILGVASPSKSRIRPARHETAR